VTSESPRRGISAAVPLHAAMAAVVAAAALSVWPAAEPASAAASARVMELGGLAYVAAWALARRRTWRLFVIWTLVVAGTAFSMWLIVQYRFIAPPDLKVAALDALGRAVSAPFPQLVPWEPFANGSATLLEGLIVVATGLALGRGPAVMRGAAALAAVVMAAACLLMASRGAWMAVAVGLAVLVAYRFIARWQMALAAVAAAGLLAVVAGTVNGGTPWWIRWAGAAGRPDRLDVYGQAVALLRDMPFTGVGAGDQFAAAASRYVLLIQVPFLTYAHNLTLQLWLAHGLFGLAAWYGLAAASAVAAAAGERAGLGRRFRGVWAGLLAIHVHGLSDARQFVDPWTWAPFFALTGVLAAYVARPECRLRSATAWSPLAVAVGVVLAAAAGRGVPMAAWDVNRGAIEQARGDRLAGDGAGGGAVERARAAAHFERALERAGDDGPALRRLGLLALSEERHADAARLLAHAWAVEPGHAPTRKAYGLAAVWIGDVPLAASILAPVPGISDELVTWSRYRREQGELPLAIAAAGTALAIAPDQPEVAAWLERLQGEARASVPAAVR
jgi:O-antigen ligase